MIGGSLFYDFARVGATPAPFQSFVLSAGVVTDYVYGAGMHWQGGCGGFPCDGSGSLNEWNLIGELKAATRWAVAIRSTATSVPARRSSGRAATQPAARPASCGARPRRPCALGGTWIVSLISIGRLASVGIQHTGSAEFETTSERFRFDHKNKVTFGLNLTYTPAGN